MSLQKMNSKSPFNLGLLAATLFFICGASGCEILFPTLVQKQVNVVDPDSSINDPYSLRTKVAEACKDIPKNELMTFYGVFSAMADHIVLNVDDTATNHDVLKLTDAVLKTSGWPQGKYTQLAKVISDVYASYKIPKIEDDQGEKTLEDRLPLNRCRSQLTDVYRLIASGTRLALE